MVEHKLNTAKVINWAIYDFANTIYSAAVVTVYLPLYVTAIAGENTPVGVTATLSMIAAGIVTPVLGSLTDRLGHTKLFLILSTLLCVGATASITFLHGLPFILAAFFTANLMFHLCLVFYNSLLPVVAHPERQGFVSGLGTSLGYLGMLFALPLAHLTDQAFGRPFVFLATAVFFLVFSIPTFLGVPDRPVLDAGSENWFAQFKLIFQDKNARCFFAGNFFLVDALNAAILWMAVFLVRVFGISDGTLIKTIIALNFSAAIYAYFLGKLTDRYGSRQVMLLTIVLLGLAVITVVSARDFSFAAICLFIFGAAAIAGTWTAGRKLLIELAPPRKLGIYFGFYGLTTKVSAIGATVVAVLADWIGFRGAFLSQLISVGLAFYLISRVKGVGENKEMAQTAQAFG